jgi:hypothetical protein
MNRLLSVVALFVLAVPAFGQGATQQQASAAAASAMTRKGEAYYMGGQAYDSIYLCNLQINDLQAYRTAKRTVMTLEDYSTSGDILTAGIADWGSASGAYASGSGNFNNVGNPDYDNGTNAYNMGQWAMAMNYYTQAYNAYNAAWWSFDSARETAAAAYDRLMTEKVRLTVLYGN